MTIIRKRHIKGINLDPTDLSAESLSNPGDLAYDSSASKLKYKDGSATREVVNTDESQTFSYKTLDLTSIVQYDDTKEDVISLLKDDGTTPVENVQEALDSVKRALDNQNEANEIDYTIKTGTGDNWNDFVDDDVTKVDLALDELASRVKTTEADVYTSQSTIDNHIEISGAHAASAISVTPAGNLEAEDVQAALEELQLDIDDRALADNGTITNASIETPSRLDVKQDTEDNLETYATTASDGQIVFATDTKKMFQIIDGALQPIGGGGATQFEVIQATHGFTVGNGIFHNSISGVWEKAIADSTDTLASYVVVEVEDADTFVAADFGRLEVNLLTNPDSLSAGEFYYLSDSVAGQPTTTESSLYSNPLFYVESIDATDVNNQLAVLQVKVYRPEQVEADEVIYLVAKENISAKDALYIDGSGQVGLVDSNDDDKIEFIGFAKRSVTIGNPVEVAVAGKLTGFTGLVPGNFVYIDPINPGKLIQPEPTQANVYIIKAGKAISSTEILINPDLASSAEFNREVVADMTITNNQLIATSISGLVFSGLLYRAVVLRYSIYRVTDDNEVTQTGQLRLTYRSNAGTWSLSDDFGGDDAGVTFSVDSTGKILYTSSDLTGANYDSKLQVSTVELFEV